MPSLSEELSFRGLIEQESAGVRAALDERRFSAYVGFDPTAASLHIGHLLCIVTLRRLQDAGHRPIALAGGGTGLIGDPGGKDAERPLLTKEQHTLNMAGIRAQLEGLLDFSPERGESQALLLDNGDWLVDFRLVDFLRDIGKHFTVNQMTAKESVRTRLERPEQGISFTEFSYMLLQATDFLHLFENYGCLLQAGGSDQWGNITMGLELIRKIHHQEAFAFTWPLLMRSDGKKFGKSEDGAIWLDRKLTSPFAMYQWFFRVPDADVVGLLKQFTFLPHDEILELERATRDHPERRQAQRALAAAVCDFVHGPAETAGAERASAALYSEEIASLDARLMLDVVSDAPSSVVARARLDGPGVDLAEALLATGLVKSKSDSRRTISQGGVYVNNVRRQDPATAISHGDLLQGKYVLLRKGKQDYHVLCFE
jgi:tyrosyl-tRNA synthetase